MVFFRWLWLPHSIDVIEERVALHNRLLLALAYLMIGRQPVNLRWFCLGFTLGIARGAAELTRTQNWPSPVAEHKLSAEPASLSWPICKVTHPSS